MGDGRETRLADRTAHAHRGPRIRGFDAAVVGAGGGMVRASRETSPLAVHATIPPVLHGVVAAVAQSSCDLGPSLSHLVDHALDHQPLLGGDGFTVQRRLQILVEALPTLLGRPIVHVL